MNRMIVCPVCAIQNDEYAITCSSCGSYVQDRIPTLDFFATLWLMIESPAQAFKKIIMAEHKNYVLLLAMFLGIAVSFGLMAVQKSGNSFDNLLPLLLFGSVFGGVIGLPFFYALTGLLHGMAIVFGGSGKYTSTYGVTGWSQMPMVFLVVFVLPLMLATLGLWLFSSNPNAFQVKPTVTIVLGGFAGLLAIWSMILLIMGISKAHKVSIVRSTVITLSVISAASLGMLELYSLFNI